MEEKEKEKEDTAENIMKDLKSGFPFGNVESLASMAKVDCKVLKPVLDSMEKQFKFCMEECDANEKCFIKAKALEAAMDFGKEIGKKEATDDGVPFEKLQQLEMLKHLNKIERILAPGQALVFGDANGLRYIVNTGKAIKVTRSKKD